MSETKSIFMLLMEGENWHGVMNDEYISRWARCLSLKHLHSVGHICRGLIGPLDSYRESIEL